MGKHKKVIAFLFSVLLILATTVVFLWIRFGQRANRYQCTNYAMDTYIQQTVYGKKAQSAAAAAAKSISSLEDLISWQIDGSDVARLNLAAGTDWITINPKTTQLLKLSLEVAAESDGALDPTILPISSLWDFSGNNQHVPSKSELEKYLPFVNYKNLHINAANNTASLRDHFMGIDLDNIEKGAACDESVAAYKSSGAECGIISVGDSIGTFGKKEDGTNWSIAVRDPASSETDAVAMGEISLTTGFVSTSGTYQKNFKQNGILYHYLLNSKTGYPQNNGLVSVTVTADNGALSDALSTACFILGREKSEILLKKYNAGAIFIDNNNHVYVTNNLKNSFKITNSKYILQ